MELGEEAYIEALRSQIIERVKDCGDLKTLHLFKTLLGLV